MTTLYFTHDSYLAHDMGPGHPESPARLRAIDAALADADIGRRLTRRTADAAPLDAIRRVHDADYIDALLAAVPATGLHQIDPDTAINPHSLTAARHASGALLAAVDAVLAGEADNAFCAVRPPGHHATRRRAMGFCLFNHVAVAAAHALAHHGLDRVAIVDFDVHHGNGTEDILAGDVADDLGNVLGDDKRLLFCSSYQYPLWPFPDNAGIPGRIVKTPLEPGSDGAAMRRAVSDVWLPALDAFKPQMLLISAGFDAHAADPLAGLNWTVDDYRWISEQLTGAAQQLCHGRLVSTLEGGYALDALAESAVAHLETLAAAAD